MAIAYAISFTFPKTYEAYGQALVDGATLPSARQGYRGKRDLNAQLGLMSGGVFLKSVIQRMSPQERDALVNPKGRQRAAPAREESLLQQRLARGLQVTLRTRTNLIDFTFADRQPALAASVVNDAMDAATTLGTTTALSRRDQVAAFYQQRLTELSDQIKDLRRQEQAFPPGILNLSFGLRTETQQLGVIGAGITADIGNAARKRKMLRSGRNVEEVVIRPEDDAVDPALPLLAAAATDAELTATLAEGRVNLLKDLLALDPRAFGDQDVRSTLFLLRKHLDQAQASYAALSQTLGPQQPEMLARKAEIEQLQQDLDRGSIDRLRAAQLEAATARNDAHTLDSAVRRQSEQEARTLAERARARAVALDLALALSLYEDIRQMLLTARITSGLNAVRISVLDPAELPTDPITGKLKLLLISAGLLGLVVGTFFAAISAVRSLGHWTLEGLEASSQLPALAIIPRGPVHEEQVVEETQNSLAAVYHFLQSLPAPSHARTVLLTTGQSDDSRTGFADALALHLAKLGERVLLVKADMHAAHGSRFSLPPAGLSNVLEGRLALEAAVMPSKATPALQVLHAGPPTPAASMLIASAAMAQLLDRASTQYDYVLLEGPAVFDFTDSLTLVKRCHLSLLVAPYGRTSLKQIGQASYRLLLAGARYAGVIAVEAPAS